MKTRLDKVSEYRKYVREEGNDEDRLAYLLP